MVLALRRTLVISCSTGLGRVNVVFCKIIHRYHCFWKVEMILVIQQKQRERHHAVAPPTKKKKMLFTFCNCIVINCIRVLGHPGDWFCRARQNQWMNSVSPWYWRDWDWKLMQRLLLITINQMQVFAENRFMEMDANLSFFCQFSEN